MPASSVLWLLATLNGAVLVTVLGVAFYVYTRRETASMDRALDWRVGTYELACEVHRIATSIDRPPDHDRVARRLLPLAGRIRAHVRNAPHSVEEPVYRDLFALGVTCQRIGLEHRPQTSASGPFLEDRLEVLEEAAAALAARTESPPVNTGSNAANAT